MGGDNSKSGGSSRDKPGLNQYCYQTGYDHATNNSSEPDPVGEGIAAAPCTTNSGASKSYGRGFSDGYKDRFHAR
jgi:hypothetical protein